MSTKNPFMDLCSFDDNFLTNFVICVFVASYRMSLHFSRLKDYIYVVGSKLNSNVNKHLTYVKGGYR